MADKWPLATGNWSNAANWNGGTLPTSADDVYADGKTVTIDQDITVRTLRNTQRTGGTNSGGFIIGDGKNITCTSGISTSTGANCLTYSGNSNITINSNITGGTGVYGLYITSTTPTVTIFGDIRSGSSNPGGAIYTNAPVVITGNVLLSGGVGGIIVSALYTSDVTVTGSVSGGNGSSTGTIGICGQNGNTGAAGAVTVTGNVTGGTTGPGIWTATTKANAVTVTGNVTSTAFTGCHGITSTTLNILRNIAVVGNVTASNVGTSIGTHGVYDAGIGGWTIVGGSITDSTNGDVGVCARRFRCIPTLNTTHRYANDTGFPNGGYVTYASLDAVTSAVPVPANVRSGTTYGDNNSFTGTMSVPPAAAVQIGVPVDNTTGTAILSVADFSAFVAAAAAAAVKAAP